MVDYDQRESSGICEIGQGKNRQSSIVWPRQRNYLGVWSDTGSLVPPVITVPPVVAIPSPWNQSMEVDQLPEKPPSPPAVPPRRTPEFKVPQHPTPRRVASGSGFAGWGAGLSVVPGEGWKVVTPMKTLVYGTMMQANLRVRQNHRILMRDAKDVNLKLWGKNPVGLDGDNKSTLPWWT